MFLCSSKLLLIITCDYSNYSKLYELQRVTLDFFDLDLASQATKRLLLVVEPAVLQALLRTAKQLPTLLKKMFKYFIDAEANANCI